MYLYTWLFVLEKNRNFMSKNRSVCAQFRSPSFFCQSLSSRGSHSAAMQMPLMDLHAPGLPLPMSTGLAPSARLDQVGKVV